MQIAPLDYNEFNYENGVIGLPQQSSYGSFY